MSSSDQSPAEPSDSSVITMEPKLRDIIVEYIGDGDLSTFASAWNMRLATISIGIDDTVPVGKTGLTKKQTRRIKKQRGEIALLNTTIDALNHYFISWFKKFETGEIGREQLVTNIVDIDSTIRMHESRRDVVRLQLDQFNVN